MEHVMNVTNGQNGLSSMKLIKGKEKIKKYRSKMGDDSSFTCIFSAVH